MSLSRGGLGRDRLGSSGRCRDGPFRAAEAGGTQKLGNPNTGAAWQGESSPHPDVHHSTTRVHHHFLGAFAVSQACRLTFPLPSAKR
jgi:hypothetical protein